MRGAGAQIEVDGAVWGQQGSGQLCGRAYAELGDGRGSRVMDAMELWSLRLAKLDSGRCAIELIVGIRGVECAASPSNDGDIVNYGGGQVSFDGVGGRSSLSEVCGWRVETLAGGRAQ